MNDDKNKTFVKMIIKLFPFTARSIQLLATIAFTLVAFSAAAVVNMTVTPLTISNTYSGMITFQVTGLTNGEKIQIEKYLDLNTNGVIDAADYLTASFKVVDNTANIIGGATNYNQPYDIDSTGGSVSAQMNFTHPDTTHIVGKYLIRLSSPFSRFTPLTNSFTITNANFAQSFSGVVKSGSTNMTNAVVVLLQPNGKDQDFIAGTVADNSGNYSLKAAPGSYVLIASRSNYVCDFSTAPFLTLNNSSSIVTNLFLTNATRTISGRIADISSSNPLAGCFVNAQSTNNLFALAFTDTNGNFSLRVTSSKWKVQTEEGDYAFRGYLKLQNKANVDATSGDVSNVNILTPKGTALFYGSVRTEANVPLAGISFFGNDGVGNYESTGLSDTNGNYAAVATNGFWGIYPDSQSSPVLTNYILTSGWGNTNVSDGQAILQNFIAKIATNRITGYVHGTNSTPISGVKVFAHAVINGTNYDTGDAITDSNGNYSLNVANGFWEVGLNCQGDVDLGSMGYQCPGNLQTNINNNNGVVNFDLQPCGGLQVSTTNLPDGILYQYYGVQLQASGCNQPFSWSIVSGSIPSNFSLDSFGNFQGNPTNFGTYNFTVRVTDSTSATADQPLSLYIAAPPAPTLTSYGKPSPSQFQFNINSTVNATFIFQYSTNLTNWIGFATNSGTGTFNVSDFNATNKYRFYRALIGN